ncbi:MAG: hypothetical protein CMJ78_24550 [Planctomycetaceae bacterium]|nr:hypothetical protein [Planctomycetaceae bacterium]
MSRIARLLLSKDVLEADVETRVSAEHAALWFAAQSSSSLHVPQQAISAADDELSAFEKTASEYGVQLEGLEDADSFDAGFVVSTQPQTGCTSLQVVAGLDLDEEPMLLLVTDGSEAAFEAVDFVMSGGFFYDAKVHLLLVVDNEESRESLEVEVHDQLSRTDFRTLTFGVLVHVEVAAMKDVVARFLEEQDIDLVVCDKSIADNVGEVACSQLIIRE